jgi:hypothetical protein
MLWFLRWVKVIRESGVLFAPVTGHFLVVRPIVETALLANRSEKFSNVCVKARNS